MPSRACSLLTTSGPIWKFAPPPVIEKLKLLPEAKAVATEKLRSSVGVSIEACSPLPVAATPLTVTFTSVPAAAGGQRRAELVDGVEACR